MAITQAEIDRAMWEGDTDWLDEHLPCGCCCYEHTSLDCPARLWYGCRGNGSDDYNIDDWYKLYKDRMTYDEFCGYTG